MQRSLVIVSRAAGSAILFGASGRSAPSLTPKEAAEVTRLQRHFDAVDGELRSRDVSELSVAQRASRARLISWLREYRQAATFPTNDRFASATPFFRDASGTLCAMAYLIDRSGRSDIVDKVAATRNNAYIRELVDDPALIAWLDSAGLSVAEAARIQPAYDGPGFPGFPDRTDRVSSDFALAALGLGGASLATSAVNALRPSYLGGALGIIAGGAALAVAASRFDDGPGTERLAVATAATGAISLGAGVYGLLAARSADRDRDDWREGRRKRRSTIVAPDVIVQSGEPRYGVLLKSVF